MSKTSISRILYSIIKLYPLRFTIRFILLNIKIKTFDRKQPYKGDIAINRGWMKEEISEKTQHILNDTYTRYHLGKNKVNITIDTHNILAINEIISKLKFHITEYIGEDVKIDGMFFMASKASFNSISSNWHTDNVGSRLKAFICIKGNSTQPTLLLQSNKDIPNLRYILTTYILEILRWFGINHKLGITKAKSLKHRTNSIYVFDTQYLHRGAYEIGYGERIVLVIEFSNPNKHKILSRGLLKGPIGTNEENQFIIKSDKLLSEELTSLLDIKRLRQEGKEIHYVPIQ